VILEEKHSNSLVNTIVLEQEQLSESNRNQIKQLEAEIELLTSQTNSVISTNTQTSKTSAAEERSALRISNNSFCFRCYILRQNVLIPRCDDHRVQ
jgi:hypothetical protein